MNNHKRVKNSNISEPFSPLSSSYSVVCFSFMRLAFLELAFIVGVFRIAFVVFAFCPTARATLFKCLANRL